MTLKIDRAGMIMPTFDWSKSLDTYLNEILDKLFTSDKIPIIYKSRNEVAFVALITATVFNFTIFITHLLRDSKTWDTGSRISDII